MKSQLDELISTIDDGIEEFALRNTFQKVIDGNESYINSIGKQNNPITNVINRIRLGGPGIPQATIDDKTLLDALWNDVNSWNNEGLNIDIAHVASCILNYKYTPNELKAEISSDIVESVIRETDSSIDNIHSLNEIVTNSKVNSNLYKIAKHRLSTLKLECKYSL
ncbi:MAG: hypothetical protein ABIJ08_07470 [Nanoarchaeota archaeon]